MVNFQKLESCVAVLEKQLQEVKEQLAEVRNEYQEECHPGKTDIREYILEKATERFGEYYRKPEKDKVFFDNFYDAVKRKVKKDSIIMGESGGYVGMVFCDDAMYAFNTYNPFKMQFMVKYDALEDITYERANHDDYIRITLSENAIGNKSMATWYLDDGTTGGAEGLVLRSWRSDYCLSKLYTFILDILEYINA